MSLFNRKNKNDNLDKFTVNYYTKLLDTIIQYKTIYHIDKVFGKSFAMKQEVTSDISNDDIAQALEDVIVDIVSTIAPKMKNYLVNIYGEKWLNDYIRIESLSLLLNYERLTVNNLTLEKFK